MATDPGVVDAYLSLLQSEIDRRQAELGQVVEQLKTARLEQRALATLTADVVDALAAARVTGQLDAAALVAKRDQLRAEIQAINSLQAAAKGAA